ncbi:MAG: chromate transporter [Burkholderiaceae bacterium]|jgi:chromate transporter
MNAPELQAAPELTGLAPRDCTELFQVFNRLALQGFGGVMAVAHRELVERRRWLSNAQYLQEVALAQALPGPNVCNLALMLGDRHFGWRGACAALGGLVAVPLLILLALVMLYGAWAGQAQVDGMLRGMGAVVAGMIAGTALKLGRELRHHPIGLGPALVLALCTFTALALLRWPIAALILSLGGLGVAWTWWMLKRKASA